MAQVLFFIIHSYSTDRESFEIENRLLVKEIYGVIILKDDGK